MDSLGVVVRLSVVLGAVTAAAVVAAAGCAQGNIAFDENEGVAGTGTSSGGGAGGAGGAAGGAAGGGAVAWPCGIDCSAIETDACHKGVCNEESGQCAFVAAEDGTACEDGLFCTLGDQRAAGVCKSGAQQNDCDLEPPVCQVAQCVENSKTCTTAPAPQFTPCKTDDLCLVATYCQNGLCTGQKKDCTFAPMPDQCHVGVCNPQNGTCEPVVGNECKDCTDQSDLCTVGKKCAAGVCAGGKPKDCSQLTKGCVMGVCDVKTGNCVAQAVKEGEKCDDLNACTSGEVCTAGQCGPGAPVVACKGGDSCCPPGCNEVNDPDCACGNDCWSDQGCKTLGGKCIRFSCKRGDQSANFCQSCFGGPWKDVTYNQWMNGGYCADVIAKYRESNKTETKCGDSQKHCCQPSSNCGGGDNAWHFHDGANNRYVGPALGWNDVNCKNWDGTDNSSYTRLTVCEKK
ncbi:MAG: hypothetical protein HY744_03185 [Deltaproteobacteria bacterium]|nr:hypothetical protein [Deltaproteobacteria bacterium]